LFVLIGRAIHFSFSALLADGRAIGTILAMHIPGCSRKECVKFEIDIGETEKHRLAYQYNQLLGRLVIKVNQKPVKEITRLLNEPLLEIHELTLGRQETFNVRIEKERKAFFGHTNRLYVNNRLFRVYEGL
jgi:hypothetical protein